jgi:hypothetical protein
LGAQSAPGAAVPNGLRLYSVYVAPYIIKSSLLKMYDSAEAVDVRAQCLAREMLCTPVHPEAVVVDPVDRQKTEVPQYLMDNP